MLQSSDQLGGPSLDLLQFFNVSLYLGNHKLDTTINTQIKWSTGMPNRVNKPSPWCAYNILTSPVSASHYCHKTASLTHVQVFVPQNPPVLFLLSSQLVSSLCCCRGLFRCRDLHLPVLNFTMFHKVSPAHWGSSGPYPCCNCPAQFDTNHKLRPIIWVLTGVVKQEAVRDQYEVVASLTST